MPKNDSRLENRSVILPLLTADDSVFYNDGNHLDPNSNKSLTPCTSTSSQGCRVSTVETAGCGTDRSESGKISFGPWIPASSNESIENYRQDNKYEIQISRNKTLLRETSVFNLEEHKGDSAR